MEKSLVLSVSAGVGCYRHIQINQNETLERLSETILYAFDFDDGHLHSFFMNNQAWDEDNEYMSRGLDFDIHTIEDKYLDGALGFTDDVKLSEFNLNKGYKFLYIYDYGDDWRFHIRVLRVVNDATETPVVLKSVGKLSQYVYYESDED